MSGASAVERAARAASLGHEARPTTAQRRELADLVQSDPDARVRTVALGALVRIGPRREAAVAWSIAANAGDVALRRRAAELAPALGAAVPARALLVLLADDDALVAEAAAFALGEHPRAGARALTGLGQTASSHDDPIVREAAVAALGSRGDPRSREIVLAACDDKPAIRRRAVLALAAFDGPDVEARLHRALTDRDWQVRQAAEDLLGVDSDAARGERVSRAGPSAP